MSEQNERPYSRSTSLSQDSLVDQFRPSPTDPPPEAVNLIGFLGRDSEDGYWRLYVDIGLETYLRIAEADVIAREECGPAGRAFAPSRITVKATAIVTKVETVPLNIQAGFLKGSYTEAFYAAAADVSGRATPVRSRRVRRNGEDHLLYPDPGQCTIEGRTCFCTIFCEQ
jgi:hypothetical protein